MRKYFLLAGWIFGTIVLNAQDARFTAQKSGEGAVLLHEVQAKEGLYTLSRLYGMKVAEIAAANGLSKDAYLQIGQKVQIPLTAANLSQKKGKTPVYYTAAGGETFTAISNRFNKVSIKNLKSWNKIKEDVVPEDKEVIVGYFTAPAATVAPPAKKPGDAATPGKLPAKPVSKAVVVATNVNIRKGPATNEEVVGIARQGDVVEVLEKIDKDWVAARTKEGVEGYLAAQFIQAAAPWPTVTKMAAVQPAIVSGTNINVRKSPATDAEVVGVLQQGDVVEVLKTINEEWVSIRSQDGAQGFVASRFLAIGTAKVATEKKAPPPTTTRPEQKAKAYATKINIRKGPSTEQEIIAIAQPDEVLTYLRKADNEWSEVRNAEGRTGFVATRFLSFNGAPSFAAVEAENQAKIQAEAMAAAKKEAERQAAAAERNTELTQGAAVNAPGFFKPEFEKHNAANPLSEQVLLSGIFKTDRGWNDGKYYLLMDQVAAGTVVILTNPGNNQSVYAKVLGKMKGTQYAEGLDMRISDAAAEKLQTQGAEKFNIKVLH